MVDLTENIRRTLQFTGEITEKYPARNAGSVNCAAAVERIAAEFAAILGKNNVHIETFSCRPGGFLGWIKTAVVAYVVGSVLLLLRCPIGAATAFVAALTLFASQLVFYLGWFDVFFAKKTGYNVIGTLEPKSEVRRQIILTGHHDAPFVFNYLDHFPKYYPQLVQMAILSLVVGLAMAITGIATGAPRWTSIPVLIGLVGVLPLWCFIGKKVSPGAGDNMVSIALCLEIAAMLTSWEKLQHTRIVFASFDAEECGLRGSLDYVRYHLVELQALPTEVIAIDTIYHPDRLVFLNRDLNSTCPLSGELVAKLLAEANAKGYGAKTVPMPFGGGATDAASFAQAGIPATCLLAFDLNGSKIPKNLPYHTSHDTVSQIDPAAVAQILSLLSGYLEKSDRAV